MSLGPQDNFNLRVSEHEDGTEKILRLFLEEHPECFIGNLKDATKIRREISRFFLIPYRSVIFCGSAQLGFSPYKETSFAMGRSDLDVACINGDLFQKAWIDVVSRSRGFTDLSVFPLSGNHEINYFKEKIYKRGMIYVSEMPVTPLVDSWNAFSFELSRKFHNLFSRITFAIYLNEYAFCWKQNSILKGARSHGKQP